MNGQKIKLITRSSSEIKISREREWSGDPFLFKKLYVSVSCTGLPYESRVTSTWLIVGALVLYKLLVEGVSLWVKWGGK